MPQFLITYGHREQTDIIERDTLDEARDEATTRSMEEGILDDDLPDTTWAELYDPDVHAVEPKPLMRPR